MIATFFFFTVVTIRGTSYSQLLMSENGEPFVPHIFMLPSPTSKYACLWTLRTGMYFLLSLLRWSQFENVLPLLYTFPVETCWFPCWMLRLLPVHSSHRRHHCLCKMSATSWFMHLLSSLKCSPMCSKSAQRVPSKASEGLQALATPSSPHLETALHLDLLLSVLVSGVLPLQRQSLPATAASPSLADPSLGSGYSSRLGSSIISSESPSKVKNLLV